MPRARAKRSGRYKYGSINGPQEKEIYLKNYYAKHKKAIDAAISKYKERKNIPGNIDNEKLFVDRLKWGRDFGSTRQAKAAIEKSILEFKGEDSNWYDAKHGSNKELYGDLRGLNGFKPKFVDYKYTDSSGDWGIDGYYETNDPDIIIVNKIEYPSQDSPYSYWEYMTRDEAGL